MPRPFEVHQQNRDIKANFDLLEVLLENLEHFNFKRNGVKNIDHHGIEMG